MKYRQTPNISKDVLIKPKGIILHHTAGTFNGSVSWILNPISKVSYHYVSDIDGEIIQFAKDTQKCWHAGKSSFKGLKNCNDFMIGVAVSGDTNKRLINILEVDAVAKLCVKLMQKFNFTEDWITTHQKVSPGRKNDIDVRSEKLIRDRINELLKVAINYEVKAGDTLFSIAKRFNTTVNVIKKLNNLTNNNLKISQKILLP